MKYATVDTKVPENLLELLKKAAPLIWKGKASERTMCRNIEEAHEILGKPKLTEINTSLVDQYKMILMAKLSPSTVNYKLVNLSRLLRFAVEREWVTKLPKFEQLPVCDSRERVFTEKELVDVLSFMNSKGHQESADFHEILYLTGMRKGELLKAQSSQIQGDWLVLKAKDTKTKKARRVPLNARCRELLEKNLPFKLSANTYGNHWNEARDALGFKDDPEFVPHVLRHTRATMALSKTRNLAVVQKLLGHSSIKTTQRYAKVLDDDLMAAV